MKHFRKWRNRLTTEVFVLSGQRFRITRRRGRIVGLEVWAEPAEPGGAYGYVVWKGRVR